VRRYQHTADIGGGCGQIVLSREVFPKGSVERKPADAAQLTRCRENSPGILVGCSGHQHKWQKFRDIFVVRKWRGASGS
jgi:hypothetical protein